MDELELYELVFKLLLEKVDGDISKIPKPVLLELPEEVSIEEDDCWEENDPYIIKLIALCPGSRAIVY